MRWLWSVSENAGQLFTAVYVAPSPSAPWPAELVEADLAAGFAHNEELSVELCLVIDISCSCFLSGPSHGLILLWVDLNPEEEWRTIERNWAVGFATVCSWDMWYCCFVYLCLKSARLLSYAQNHFLHALCNFAVLVV